MFVGKSGLSTQKLTLATISSTKLLLPTSIPPSIPQQAKKAHQIKLLKASRNLRRLSEALEIVWVAYFLEEAHV
jgi:hypothetical protein